MCLKGFVTDQMCVFRQRGFDIKWLDDTRVLGLFSSPIAGQCLTDVL